jgi:hypothetical protein
MGRANSLSRLFEITNLKKQIGKLVVFALPGLALGIIASRHPVLYARSMESPQQLTANQESSFQLYDSTGAPLIGSITRSMKVLGEQPPAADPHQTLTASAVQHRQACPSYPTVSETVDIGVPTDVFGFDLSRAGVLFPNCAEAQLSGSNDCVHFEPVVTAKSPGAQRIAGRYRFWRVVYSFNRTAGKTISNGIKSNS